MTSYDCDRSNRQRSVANGVRSLRNETASEGTGRPTLVRTYGGDQRHEIMARLGESSWADLLHAGRGAGKAVRRANANGTCPVQGIAQRDRGVEPPDLSAARHALSRPPYRWIPAQRGQRGCRTRRVGRSSSARMSMVTGAVCRAATIIAADQQERVGSRRQPRKITAMCVVHETARGHDRPRSADALEHLGAKARPASASDRASTVFSRDGACVSHQAANSLLSRRLIAIERWIECRQGLAGSSGPNARDVLLGVGRLHPMPTISGASGSRWRRSKRLRGRLAA